MICKIKQTITLLAISLFSLTANASFIDSDGHLILDFAEYSHGETVNNYGGINWSNTAAVSGFGVDDDKAGSVDFGFLGGLSLTSTDSDGFDLYDAYFKVFGDSEITINGTFIGGDAITAQSFDLTMADGWSQIDINLFNVDTLSIAASEGPSQFLIDNVDVPEPSTLALFGLGLLGLSLARVKQRK